ncbi:hypothetical protein BKA69DRAFT_1126925 [Paraphysoderma sedebokerense]|nr:hypothetical protein BKA69DRAFT_1126925 [Paraphysoderma sedebokerense]
MPFLQKTSGQTDVAFILENVLAFICFFLWSIELVPQITHNHRRKSTEGFSCVMMTVFLFGSTTIAYPVYKRLSIFLILMPISFRLLSLVCVAQHLYYSKNFSIAKSCITYIVLLTFFTFITVLTYVLMVVTQSSALVTAVGLASPIFIAVGFLPQFYTSFMLKSTEGISKNFVMIDTLAGVLYIGSIGFREGDYDVLAAAPGIAATVCQLINVGMWCVYRNNRIRSEDVEIGLTAENKRNSS